MQIVVDSRANHLHLWNISAPKHARSILLSSLDNLSVRSDIGYVGVSALSSPAIAKKISFFETPLVTPKTKKYINYF